MASQGCWRKSIQATHWHLARTEGGMFMSDLATNLSLTTTFYCFQHSCIYLHSTPPINTPCEVLSSHSICLFVSIPNESEMNSALEIRSITFLKFSLSLRLGTFWPFSGIYLRQPPLLRSFVFLMVIWLIHF